MNQFGMIIRRVCCLIEWFLSPWIYAQERTRRGKPTLLSQAAHQDARSVYFLGLSPKSGLLNPRRVSWNRVEPEQARSEWPRDKSRGPSLRSAGNSIMQGLNRRLSGRSSPTRDESQGNRMNLRRLSRSDPFGQPEIQSRKN